MMKHEGKRFRPVFVSLLTVFLLGTLGAVYWTSTPHYALRELKRSLKERDLASFYTRVDLQRLLDSLIDAAATREVTQAAGDDWINFRERFRGELSKVLKAETLTQMKKDVETWFNGQTLLDTNSEALGKLAPMREFFRRADDWRVDGSVAEARNQARVNLIVHQPKIEKSYPLVLVWEKQDIWQLVGLEGLATVMDLYERNSQEFIEKYNWRMEEDLRKSVAVRSHAVRKDQDWIVKKSLYLALGIRNLSAETMESLEGDIILSNGKSEELIRYPFRLLKTELPAGQEKIYSITADIKLFDQAANRVFAEDELQVGFAFKGAAFTGKKPFSRAQTLDDIP